MDEALIDFLIEFHAVRDYYESQKIMEQIWREADLSKNNSVWLALLQLAVGNYHYRRNNVVGAEILLTKSYEKISKNSIELTSLGIIASDLLPQVSDQMDRIKKGLPYRSINLPLTRELLIKALTKTKERKLNFYNQSNMRDSQLLNRHKCPYSNSLSKKKTN